MYCIATYSGSTTICCWWVGGFNIHVSLILSVHIVIFTILSYSGDGNAILNFYFIIVFQICV